MKKFLAAAAIFLSTLALLAGNAAAMNVNGPFGSQSSGWYKDSFSLVINYGNPSCFGPGTFNKHIFTADAAYNGIHNYKIAGDTADNPNLVLDNTIPALQLAVSCQPPTLFMPPLAFDQTVQLDAVAPQVSITNPSSNITINASTYLVSGVVSDGESGIKSVQLVVNGVPQDVPFSGNTFSGLVTLNEGSNVITAETDDVVGHNTVSSQVIITRSSGAIIPGGGTTPSSPSPTTGTPSSGSTSTTTSPQPSGSTDTTSAVSTTSSTTGTATKLKFNQKHVLGVNDSASAKASDANSVLSDDGLGNTTARSTYIIVALILLVLSAVIIWRFWPMFSNHDKNNSGLRRRIIIIVSLPSLIPLFGLGFLGYRQITHNTRAALSSQLVKAAQTASLKLEREFSIRSEVISKTASDILQIKAQIKDERAKLAQQKAACATLVNAAIPKKQYAQVTNNDDCLPFLTGFAQLASSSSAGVKDYQSALDQGEKLADDDLSAQEQQRVNELLGSVRHYFPDLYELTIVGTDETATVQAELAPGKSGKAPIVKGMTDLLKQSRTESITQVLNKNQPRLILLSLPAKLDGKTIGGAVAAIDIDQVNFMPDIWRSTPKPYASDIVFFASSQGDLLYPKTGVDVKAQDLEKMTLTAPNDVFTLKEHDQNLTTRVSQVLGTNIAVGVGAPASSVLAPLAGVQQTAILAIISFVLLSIILGILFVSGIAGEIEKLLAGALNFAKGELGYRIGLKSHDELQTLGDTMDKMAGDIKAAQTALIEKDKEFINVATHELKAPMTAIIGNLSMITEDGMGQVDETARKLIGQAYDGTVRLRNLVTDMLDVARLEAGKAQFTIESLDIGTEYEAIIAMQEIPARQANVVLAYQRDISLPKILADKTKLQIILTNFVSNAIKYNRPGGTITVGNVLKDGFVVTSVADSGLGIPQDQQAHIFEKFYRVNHEDRKDVPGTGLGMYITKGFVEAMGGKIWFESNHGTGTTFYFSLPVAPALADVLPTIVLELAKPNL